MKTYRVHILVAILLFLGIFFSSMLLNRQEILSQEWFSVQLIWWIPGAIAAFLLYFSQGIQVNEKSIIRKSILSKTKQYEISNIISVKAEGDSKKYGEIRAVVLRFKDGDFFNLFWMKESDIRDLLSKIQIVVPDTIDDNIAMFLKDQK